MCVLEITDMQMHKIISFLYVSMIPPPPPPKKKKKKKNCAALPAYTPPLIQKPFLRPCKIYGTVEKSMEM